jgi:hypothetical protein
MAGLAIVFALAAAGCRHDVPQLNGLKLGESSSSFIRSSGEGAREADHCKSTGQVSEECQILQQFIDNTFSGVMECSKRSDADFCHRFAPFGDAGVYGALIFKQGKLVSIQAKTPSTFDPAVAQLKAQNGRPSTITANGRTLSAVWQDTGYRLSVNGFKDDPSQIPTVYITLQTSEHYAIARSEQEHSQASHDSVLTSLTRDLDNQKKYQAQLEKDIAEHRPDYVINADRSVVNLDLSKMSEILLVDEVREDEAGTAKY